MRSLQALVAAAALPFLGSALAGCDGTDFGPTGTISGKLTQNGELLSPGTQVVFMHPEKGYAAHGATDAEGNFRIASFNDGNMPTGTYQVMIQPPAEQNPELSAEEILAGAAADVKLAEPEFPAKYRQISTSDLSYEVKEGENTFQIELKD